MVSYSRSVQNCAAEFKDLIIQSLQEAKTTQEAIADALATSQGTVSKWLNYGSEANLPAFSLCLLPTEFVLPLLKHVAKNHGVTVSERKEYAPEELNGDMLGEALNIGNELLRLVAFIHHENLSARDVKKTLHKITSICMKAEAQLDSLEGKQ